MVEVLVKLTMQKYRCNDCNAKFEDYTGKKCPKCNSLFTRREDWEE